MDAPAAPGSSMAGQTRAFTVQPCLCASATEHKSSVLVLGLLLPLSLPALGFSCRGLAARDAFLINCSSRQESFSTCTRVMKCALVPCLGYLPCMQSKF